ncbi:hypothetical protein [Pseudoroseicyclus tamaricis]|uniref:KTSC domain-containing protein n=1 Tax=Pseudoroseicyclus tamaricis TaxID=2705421 RepID=A0A6B2K1E2_9RHOB|nr:hypothetical protein [Pseudoroseicyclus tamaricis]NDV01542.1 hypothetical protein [Pseudoroseicyclus tamaricis]
MTDQPPMRTYADSAGTSGIEAYAVGPDHIDIAFRSGGTYRYSLDSVGEERLATMIELAEAGSGLNTYINQHVREDYEARLS